MELSFRSKIALEILAAVLGMVSVFVTYFGLLIVVVAVLLTINEIGEHKSEKIRFRNSVFEEILGVLEHMTQNPIVGERIPIPVWSERGDSDKAGLLGKTDFSSINVFYRKIADANVVQNDPYKVVEASLDLMHRDSHKAIFTEAKRLFGEVSWLKTRRSEVETVFRMLESQQYL